MASRSFVIINRDFDLKQRSTLAYYNKGSTLFIITKAIFAYVISQKKQPSEKNFRAMFLRRNKAHMPNFRPFCDNLFFFSPKSSLSMVLHSPLQLYLMAH